MTKIHYCRICSSDKMVHHLATKGYHLERCIHCDFIQVIEQPKTSELDKIYSSAYFANAKYSDERTLHREYNRRFKLIKKFVADSNAEILEYGCATGDFMNYIGKYYTCLSGIDYSDDAIKMAGINYPHLAQKLYSGTIEEIKLKNQAFDCIVAWDVIEHIYNSAIVFHELIGKLKPNGYLILSTPNIYAGFSRLTGKYWPFMTPPEHLSFFGYKTFQKLCSQSNCKPIYWKSIGKWANLGFIIYKIKKIVPRLVPAFIIKLFNKGFLKSISLYIPTGDIQYLVIKKISD